VAGIAYGDDQSLLRDEARRWLDERVPIGEVRRLAVDPRGDDPAVWKELAELGWLGLRIPEAHGGAGLGPVDLAVLTEECGRRLLPSPLLPTILAARAIETTGGDDTQARWLPRIADGSVVATLAHTEPGGAWRAAETRAEFRGGRVRGEKHHVWAGSTADLFVVPVRETGGAIRLALVENGPGVAVEAETGLDPSRRQARVRFDAAPAELLSGEVAQAATLLTEALVAISAELVGAADVLLSMTAEYAATREQFGRAIGGFQGVKHPLVNVLIQVEQARSLVYSAATALAEGNAEAELLARMAKVAASEAAVFAGSRAIQFHGGFGYTDECDAHLYLRRARCGRPAFGDPATHREWIAANLIDQGPSS
jgi:acyl-CoA dehydrogenase